MMTRFVKESMAAIFLVAKAWLYECFMNLLLWLFWGYVEMITGWFSIVINVCLGCFVAHWLISKSRCNCSAGFNYLVVFITVGCTTINIINLLAISPILTRSGFEHFILRIFVSYGEDKQNGKYVF